MTRHYPVTLLLLALLYFVDSPVAMADPNNKDPGAALAAHGSGTPKDLHAQAAALYSAATQETQTQLEAVAGGTVNGWRERRSVKRA